MDAEIFIFPMGPWQFKSDDESIENLVRKIMVYLVLKLKVYVSMYRSLEWLLTG